MNYTPKEEQKLSSALCISNLQVDSVVEEEVGSLGAEEPLDLSLLLARLNQPRGRPQYPSRAE